MLYPLRGDAVVAIVSLFLMVQNSQQTVSDTSEDILVVDEEGNIVGEAYGSRFIFLIWK